MTAQSDIAANNVITVSIDTLGGLGDGIASYQGKPVFIAKTCESEQVEARITHKNAQHITARLIRVLQPSQARAIPPCPHYDSCGGCSLQHLSQAAYQEFKQMIMARAIHAAGYAMPEGAHITFLPHNTRRRVRFTIKIQKGKRLLALNDANSHELTAIDSCLILKDKLQSRLQQIETFLQNIHESVKIQTLSLTDTPQGIDMVLGTSKEYADKIFVPLEPLQQHGVARISLVMQKQPPRTLYQWSDPTVVIKETQVPLPPTAFLQVSDEGQAALTRYVLEASSQAKHVLDLFCGLGTYSLPVSKYASVFAVDNDENAINALSQLTAENAKIRVMQRDLFKNPLKSDDIYQYDTVILNPPRAGAQKQMQAITAAACKNIIMVSCNPASFARDAKILKQAGYELVGLQGVDQFVYSTHLELAAKFKK